MTLALLYYLVGLDNVIGHGVVSDYAIAYDNGTTRVWKAST